MITSYQFTKVVRVVQLEAEIRNSAITTALHTISLNGVDALTVEFKDALSSPDEAILNNLVAAHTPVAEAIVPNTVSVVALPDPQPFAVPTYRTKRDATEDWVTCPSDTSTPMDFLLTAERYVSGGGILIKDAKEGDYISAEVMDLDEVIPVPYRPALCEAHPIIASYIVKMWVLPFEGYRKIEIDTYPLNAKISAGLYLRVTYHASSVAGDRKAAINYNLTKKL